MSSYTGLEVAIIGMSGRFPGASTITQYWENLKEAKESIHFFTKEELKKLKISEAISGHPKFVNAIGKLDGIKHFDPEFFGFTHNEAEKLSPQIRLLFECSWECLEDAGYADIPESNQIGVFYGANSQLYWEAITRFTNNEVNPFELQFLSEKDYISTLIAHKLNLGGPAVTLQTACSTSLVAIHTASRSLLTGDCEMALAGGVHLNLEVQGGYIYEEGMISSSDGHCRVFDAQADGTVGGNGGAVVFLKLLKKAIADKDHIYGIIKGSAINNDGKQKMAFSAPSVKGQRDVIRKAMKVAKINPESIQFVETHGTGTKLGDPVELEALKQAFGMCKENNCAIGSVKSNIGHLGAASGVAGLIKATLSLKYKHYPESLHFKIANPKLEIEKSPFYVNTTFKKLTAGNHPIRGAVSSFGIGGTNAHVILEEAPKKEQDKAANRYQLFPLSAHTPTALIQHIQQMIACIKTEEHLKLEEICYSLQVGRKKLNYRTAFLVQSKEELLQKLRSSLDAAMPSVKILANPDELIVVFNSEMQPHRYEELFTSNQHFAKCISENLSLITEEDKNRIENGIRNGTVLASDEAVSFLLVQYALYQILMDAGILPKAIMAEGRGELTAACASGMVDLKLLIHQLSTMPLTLTIDTPFLANPKMNVFLGSYNKWMSATDHVTEKNISLSLKWNDVNGNLISVISKREDFLLLAIGDDKQLSEKASTLIKQGNEKKQIFTISPSAGRSIFECFYRQLANLWEKGVSINWDSIHLDKPYKVSLPALPFQRSEYWLKYTLDDLLSGMESNKLITKNNLSDWFLEPTWHCNKNILQINASKEMGYTLLFTSMSEAGQLPVFENGKGSFVIDGDTFKVLGDNNFQIRLGVEEDYKNVFNHLSKTGILPSRIVHAFCLHHSKTVKRGLESLIQLIRSAVSVLKNNKVELLVLTNNAFDLSGEETIDPERAFLMGPVIVAGQEYQTIQTALVDIDMQNVETRATLSRFLSYPDKVKLNAIRGRNIWERHYKSTTSKSLHPVIIEQQGVYVITGGLGELGLKFANYIADQAATKIILLGRSALSSGNEKNNQLQKISEKGTVVEYMQCDISDAVQADKILSDIQKKYRKINGIIHGAALLKGNVQLISGWDINNAEAQFLPKVSGVNAIENFVKKQPVGFVLLMSSLASVIGGIGFASYASANAYLDFVAMKNQMDPSTKWISVNWDAWYAEAMDTAGLGKEITASSIKQEEGHEAFLQLLASYPGQIIVSTTDFQSRVKKWIDRSDDVKEKVEKDQITYHKRADLTADYVAPENKLEKEIANIWQAYFMIDKIGTEDSFYELGGDSLKGMSLVKQYSNLLGMNVDIGIVFDASTVKETIEILQRDYPDACIQFFQQKEKPVEDVPSIENETTDDQVTYYPLTSQQKRLYFLQLLQEDNINYNLPRIVRLSDEVDTERLQQALQLLINRHDVLRTAFVIENEVPQQKVISSVQIVVEEIPDRLTPLQARQRFSSPFNLAEAPLFRVKVFYSPLGEKYLFTDIHHIITDGTSKEIIEKELFALLKSESLPKVKAQYGAYAEYQNSAGYEQKLERERAYWFNEFSGEALELALPIDYPRVHIPNFEGSEVSFFIDEQLTNDVRKYGIEHNCTSFVLLLSALKLTLAKLTSANDLVIGTPLEGRMNDRFSNTLGLFVNTLAIRTQPDSEKTIEEFVISVKQKVVNSLIHQELPFDDIVDHLNINRVLGRNPLFDVMFNLQSYKDVTIDATKEELYTGDGVARFDLNFRGIETAKTIHFKISYAKQLYKPATINRIVALYKSLLSQIIHCNSQSIAQLKIDEEQKNELLQLNDSYKELKPITVIDWFSNVLEKNKNKTAVWAQQQSYSFEKLEERINQISNYILDLNLPQQSHIAVFMKPGFDLVASILAVVKTGNVFLPIDLDTPVERVTYFLLDSGARLILTDQDISSKHDFNSIVCQNVKSIATTLKLSQPLPPVNWEDNLYTIYTSGSTGMPKGVTVSHKNLVNYITWAIDKTGITAKDEFLLINNFAFDAVYTVFFGALLSGATLHIMAKDEYLSPDVVTMYIEKQKITYLKFTPSMGNLLLQHDLFKSRMKSLRFLMIGGEQIRVKDLARIKELLPALTVMNHYGPTETTIGSVATIISDNFLETYLQTPVLGTGIYNTNLYVLDSQKELLPFGSVGELYISGLGVSKGYIGNMKLSAGAFMADPFSSFPVMYKTGDLAKWTSDGYLLILGRKDDQVKINGFRIQLCEVEKAMAKCKHVKQAVVIDLETTEENKELIAYFTASEKLTLAELRTQLNQSLPVYMIPAYMVQVDTFPINKNGKLEKAKLPDYKEHALANLYNYIAPVSEIEMKIHEIWSAVLSKPKIGIEDNFFEIGGNSIKLVQLSTKLNICFNTNELLTTFFQRPNIREQAIFFASALNSNKQESMDTINASVEEMNDVLNILTE